MRRKREEEGERERESAKDRDLPSANSLPQKPTGIRGGLGKVRSWKPKPDSGSDLSTCVISGRYWKRSIPG